MTKKEEAQARKEEKLKAEKVRISTMKLFEKEISVRLQPSLGRRVLICGIDEAGRGPFAGPVVAGAVILDFSNPEKEILYLNDSKKLSEKKREILYQEILSKADAVGIGYAGAQLIDQINILQATFHAMRMAVANLTNVSHLADEHEGRAVSEKAQEAGIHELVKRIVRYEIPDACKIQKNTDQNVRNIVVPDYILADAVHIPDIEIPQEGIIKGDAKSISIAAGSIIAKVTRDHIMYEYDRIYPEYGFSSHKGYGTKAHIEAIRRYGMTPIHRRSFIHFS